MTDRAKETPTLRMRRLDTARIELLDVLQEQRIVTLFQPILDARTRRMHGCEALSRGPSDSWLHSPLNLLEAAGHAGVRLDLEFRCIELALRTGIKDMQFQSETFGHSADGFFICLGKRGRSRVYEECHCTRCGDELVQQSQSDRCHRDI